VRHVNPAHSGFPPHAAFGAACAATVPLRCDQRIRPSWIAPAGHRRLVLSPSGRTATRRNSLGGGISSRGLKLDWCNPFEVRWLKQKRRCPGPRGGEESTVNRSWTRQLVVTWKRRSEVTTMVPAARRDVSRFSDLVFRASTTLTPLNPAARSNLRAARSSQRMDVVLTDRAGNRARAAAENFSHALDPPVGDRTRQMLLGDVTIPLTSFAGVDLERIRSVGLGFGVRGRRHGQVQIADLAFQGSSGAVLRRPALATSAEGPAPGPGTAVDAIRIPAATSAASECGAGDDVAVRAGPEIVGGKLLVHGTIDAPGCGARVQVALFERQGALCRFVSVEGGYGPPQDCGRLVSLVATLGEGGNWSLSIPFDATGEIPEVAVVAVSDMMSG